MKGATLIAVCALLAASPALADERPSCPDLVKTRGKRRKPDAKLRELLQSRVWCVSNMPTKERHGLDAYAKREFLAGAVTRVVGGVSECWTLEGSTLFITPDGSAWRSSRLRSGKDHGAPFIVARDVVYSECPPEVPDDLPPNDR